MYMLVLKHGLLENTRDLYVIFLLKPQFRVDFQLPHLIAGGYGFCLEHIGKAYKYWTY